MKKTENTLLALVRDSIAGTFSPEGEAAVKALSHGELEELVELAGLHHLTALVGREIYTLRPDWPQAGFLRKSTLMTGAESARRASELAELTRALEDEGIPYAVVKGAVLRDLYPDPDLRISTDEDLLAADLAPEKVLRERGFRQAEGERGSTHTWTGRSLRVELHTDLLEGWDFPGVDPGVFSGALADRRRTETAWGPLFAMDPQTHFLYLVLHFYKHFLTGGIGLRQVCDLVLFAQRRAGELNWPEIWDFLEKARLDVLVWNLLDIGRTRLGVEVPAPGRTLPPPDSEDLLLDILAAGAYGSSTVERKRSSRITMAAARSGSAGRASALRALFPDRQAMAGRYPYVEKRPWLLPAAWCGRLWGYVRSGGASGASRSAELGRSRTALLKKYGILED